MNFESCLVNLVLNRLSVNDLPLIARQAVEQGDCSWEFIQLAKYVGLSDVAIRRCLDDLLATCGWTYPLPEQAALLMARSIAQEVIDRKISGYAGAKRIWTEVVTHFPNIQLLRVFAGYASEYEDSSTDREFYEAAILKECENLISSPTG
jgi:hypothetical protein